MRVRLVFPLLASVFLLGRTDAKVVTGSFKVSPTRKDDRVHYITQFACSIGECKYRVRAGIRSPFALVAWAKSKLMDLTSFKTNHDALLRAPPAKLVIRIVLDDEWEKSHHMAPCDRADLARGRTTLQIPLNGTFGPWNQNTFRQTYRPHFWYFFGEDCRNGITEQLAKAAEAPPENFDDYEIFYEMEIFQADGSHLSFELVGMIKWNIAQMIACAAILAYLVRKQMKVMKNQRFQLHIMCQILNASMIVSIWGNLVHILHLWKLSETGLRFPLLDALADGGFMLAQVAISSCLILIALGVTLNAPERMPMSVLSFLGAFICVAHFVVVSHPCFILLYFSLPQILLDKYLADMRFKYYASEGPIGWVLIIFRFALWGLFLICWQSTRTDKRTPGATDRFLRRVLVPASAYFLTYPLLLLITGLCKPYWRNAFFFHSSFILQLAAVFWLAEVFLTKGEYFKVSQMSQSFLPVIPPLHLFCIGNFVRGEYGDQLFQPIMSIKRADFFFFKKINYMGHCSPSPPPANSPTLRWRDRLFCSAAVVVDIANLVNPNADFHAAANLVAHAVPDTKIKVDLSNVSVSSKGGALLPDEKSPDYPLHELGHSQTLPESDGRVVISLGVDARAADCDEERGIDVLDWRVLSKMQGTRDSLAADNSLANGNAAICEGSLLGQAKTIVSADGKIIQKAIIGASKAPQPMDVSVSHTQGETLLPTKHQRSEVYSIRMDSDDLKGNFVDVRLPKRTANSRAVLIKNPTLGPRIAQTKISYTPSTN